MNSHLLLFIELLISIAASLAVLGVLSRPLVNVLCRICPDEQAATFWLSYTKVMLMITPLLLVLMVDLFTRFNNPMDNLRVALMVALGGLLLGLKSIGKRLSQSITTTKESGSTT